MIQKSQKGMNKPVGVHRHIIFIKECGLDPPVYL
jgi:hypothetical protein